jgi:hypothetical protein
VLCANSKAELFAIALSGSSGCSLSSLSPINISSTVFVRWAHQVAAHRNGHITYNVVLQDGLSKVPIMVLEDLDLVP